MELKPISELKKEFRALGPSPSMTHLDRQRQALTEAVAKRIHKYIKPHPHAIDEDDIIVEREGWLTEDEMRAIAYAIVAHDNAMGDPHFELARAYRSEAQKRNAV